MPSSTAGGGSFLKYFWYSSASVPSSLIVASASLTCSRSSSFSSREREPVQLVGDDPLRDLDSALLVDRVLADLVVDDHGVHLARSQGGDGVRALGVAAHLGGIGVILGVELAGGSVLGANGRPVEIV